MRRGIGSRVRDLVTGVTMFSAAVPLVLEGSCLWVAVPGAMFGTVMLILALE